MNTLAAGVSQLGNESLRLTNSHVLKFRFGGRFFKVRMNPRIGRRGGIEIVEEIRCRRGRFGPRVPRDGRVVKQISRLREAEALSADLKGVLERFICPPPSGLFA
jgi:hypothetical protein